MAQDNIDLYQMQADFASQQAMYQQQYGDRQSQITGYRASYGDVPAMMMSGGQYAGATASGAYSGLGQLASVGARVAPTTYTPPARVHTGYYGQYSQQTGFARGAAGMMFGLETPRGVNAYQYGYNNAADFGERMGNLGVSTGIVGAGMAAGAPVGGAVGAFLGGAVGSLAGPLGMAAGSMIGGLAGNIAGYAGVDALGDVVAQRRQMNAYLESSSFRYVSAGSSMSDARVGGMDMASRKQATDFMRQMDVSDPTMKTSDLSGILQGATSMGMMTGIQGMNDFKTKFKDIVEGVKAVSKTLHTTLEEGLQVMKDLKAINIDPSQVKQVVTQADIIGRATGRTGQEVVGLGMQGAELFRGTGIGMNIGYQSNVMNLSAVRAARDSGMLSQEAIVQAGGEEALTQRMTASGLGFMQSAVGRGFGAAFYNPGMGGAGFNAQAFMQNAMNGGMDAASLAMKGAGNLSSPAAVIGFQANQAKFMTEMGKQFGGDTSIMVANAAMANARMLVGSGATKNMNDAFRMSLQEMGVSEAEIDTMIAKSKNAQGAFGTQVEAIGTAKGQSRIDEIQSTRGVSYLMNRAADIGRKAIEPAVSGADRLIDSTKQGMVNWWEGSLGIKRADLRGLDLTGTTEMSTSGMTATQADEVASYTPDRVVDLTDKRSTLGKMSTFFHTVGGSQSAGESFAEILPQLAPFGLKGTKPKSRNDVKPGEMIIKELSGGMVEVVDQKEAEGALSKFKSSMISPSQALEMKKAGKTATPKGLRSKLMQIDEKQSMDDISKSVYGKGYADLSTSEIAAIVAEAEDLSTTAGISGAKTVLDRARSDSQVADRITESVRVEQMDSAVKNIADVSVTIEKKAGYGPRGALPSNVVGLLAQAAATTDQDKKDEILGKAVEATKKSSSRYTDWTTGNLFKRFRELSSDQGLKTEFAKVNKDVNYLSGVQSLRGMDSLIGMIAEEASTRTDVDASKLVDITSKIKEQGYLGFASMSGDEEELLGKTTGGQYLLKGKRIAKVIEDVDKKAAKINSTDPSVIAVEKKRLMSEALQSEGLGAKVNGIVESYSKHGVAAAQQMTFKELTGDAASKMAIGGITGQGGMSAAGTEQGTAQQAANVQMNINIQILSALNALSSRLK